MVHLHNLADICESEVIAITETWLNNSVSDNEILNDNYVLFRKDPPDKRGGSIIFAVKYSCQSSHVNAPVNQEVLAVSVC